MRMKKEKQDQNYWLTVNCYRWEFLRRSQKYKEFYKRFKQDYLLPLKATQSSAWRFKLSHVYDSYKDEAHKKFGLSFILIEIHYPNEWLSPRKKLQSADHIIFADYQEYSPYYETLNFNPHIKRITNETSLDNFRAHNPTHEIFAISTWGKKDIPENVLQVLAQFIKDTFKQNTGAHVLKNPFSYSQGAQMEIKPLRLQASKLSIHLDDRLKVFDTFSRIQKSYGKGGYDAALLETANKLNMSIGAIKTKLTETNKYISEVSNGRFYLPQ